MRLRDKTIWFVCILLAVALLTSAGLQLESINKKRAEMKLVSNEPLKNAPPALAFATVAMGAFRGLVVDILWMRADQLKDQGQFFDAKQIAEWITTLQPRFTSVWEFHAWNMAYNISVAIPATQPDQRWQWVKNGYELLRDEGIPLNPRSIGLYRELARIFQHKIGGVTDDAHKYYKLQMAKAIGPLLGPADNDYFKALAETPADLDTVSKDPNFSPLIDALSQADEIFKDKEKFVSNYLSLRQNPDRFTPKAFETIDGFRGTKTLKDFDIFAKAYSLRRDWKLDPVLMQELNKAYGPINFQDPNVHLPLDWRHPDAHAIYWSVKGLEIASKEDYSIQETNTDRMVAHSLQALFREGKIFVYKTSKPVEVADFGDAEPVEPQESIFLRPDLRMFDSYNKSVLAIIDKYKKARSGTYESLQTGHRNMLRNAVLSFYQAGHEKQALDIYNQLRKLYPRDEFKVSLSTYVKKRFAEELASISITDAKEIVQMQLRESYFRYAMHDDDQASALEQMAKDVHEYYMKKYRDENRIDLPDLKLLRYFALIDFLNDQQYPVSMRQNLIGRIKLERPKLAKQLEKQETMLLNEQKKQQKQQESQYDQNQ